MKIITFGDLHGDDSWKGYLDEIEAHDYCVFLGDYVDSFDRLNEDIYSNLEAVISLKKRLKERVILLWGNHDIQYLFSEPPYRCSGYREEMRLALWTLFNDNKELFQLAFQIDNHLWTHAGVSIGWLQYRFKGLELLREGFSLSYLLNNAFKERQEVLFDIGKTRNGKQQVGGPLWADKSETWYKPAKGLHQIVGHTRVKKLMVSKLSENTSITYCDIIEGDNNKPYSLLIT